MRSAVREDRYLTVRKLVAVTEDLYALVCTAEALRLCDIDIVNGNTAVYRYIKFRVIVSEQRLYDESIGCELYTEAGEQAQQEPCGCTGECRSDILTRAGVVVLCAPPGVTA